jgi:glucosamine 6-phosphate synthetase-like amidotransferase/phosphosugar isomerase protein
MRTVEAAEVASQAGSPVILVTGRPDSPFGRLGLPMVDQYVEPDGGSASVNALGLVNYMASFISLILIGEELGRARGASSDAERASIDSALAAAPGLIRSTIDRHLEPLRDWTREHPLESFFVLGAGPSFGAAQFVGAKFFEAPQFAASVQQLEEWAHEQFFTHRPDRQVMILAPSGQSAGRAAEILAGIQAVNGVGIVVSDDPALLEMADLGLEVPASPGGEGMSPLHSVVPGQILAIAYQERAGRLEEKQPGLRELQHQVSRRQIGESARVSLADLR